MKRFFIRTQEQEQLARSSRSSCCLCSVYNALDTSTNAPDPRSRDENAHKWVYHAILTPPSRSMVAFLPPWQLRGRLPPKAKFTSSSNKKKTMMLTNQQHSSRCLLVERAVAWVSNTMSTQEMRRKFCLYCVLVWIARVAGNHCSHLKESHGPSFQRNHLFVWRILTTLLTKLDGKQVCSSTLLRNHVNVTGLEAKYLIGLNAIRFATMLTLNFSQMKPYGFKLCWQEECSSNKTLAL